MNQLTIRGQLATVSRAKQRDAQAIAYLLTESFHPNPGWWGWTHGWLRAGLVQDIEQRFTRSAHPYTCLIATVSGTVIATVEVAQRSIPGEWWQSMPSDPLYISNMAVAPQWRRQGIARVLLQAVEHVALEWHCPQLYLHVMADNLAASQLYTNLGYHPPRLEKTWAFFPTGSHRKVLLHKSLTSSTG